MLVIIAAYAVIEPKTMVVELFDALITSFTMLATFIYEHAADIAIVFVFALILKTLIHPVAFLLNLY